MIEVFLFGIVLGLISITLAIAIRNPQTVPTDGQNFF